MNDISTVDLHVLVKLITSLLDHYCVTILMYRLKRHYAQYEPTLQQLKKKYEVAMKEKMLSKLEKDRAVGQVAGLQSTLKSMESFKGTPPSGFQTGMYNTGTICTKCTSNGSHSLRN